ncbi:MAG TPA: hypothetical protein PLT91_03570 [Clostridia bacterium]|nr:MAG: hypothetical protein BWX97_01133 [Firmicutes bacterium ADurb.Bin146]HOD92928.1 hypothetical protein [Clostridia bacterium]HQM39300.1 hypothetical protein [Clostridia bacterium]
MKEILKTILAVIIAAVLSLIFFIAVNELFTSTPIDMSLSALSWLLYGIFLVLSFVMTYLTKKKHKMFAWSFMIASLIGLTVFHIILISVKFYY